MSTPHKTQDNIQKSTGKSVSCGHQPTPLGWWNVKRLCVYIGLYSSNKAPKINTRQTFWLEGKKFWFVFNSTSLFFPVKSSRTIHMYSCCRFPLLPHCSFSTTFAVHGVCVFDFISSAFFCQLDSSVLFFSFLCVWSHISNQKSFAMYDVVSTRQLVALKVAT